MSATERSPDQVKSDYIAQLGPELGEFFHSLTNDLTWLHAKWQQYRGLFGTDEARIALVNRSAAFCFHVVQDSLWDDVLLHICRLTDPATSLGRFKNLSFAALPPLLHAHSALQQHVEPLVSQCRAAAKFARDHRDKRLAHRDLDHALGRVATPLGGISRRDVEEVLEAFRNVMQPIYNQLLDTTMMYEDVIVRGDADALIVALKRAEKFEQLLKARKIPYSEDRD